MITSTSTSSSTVAPADQDQTTTSTSTPVESASVSITKEMQPLNESESESETGAETDSASASAAAPKPLTPVEFEFESSSPPASPLTKNALSECPDCDNGYDGNLSDTGSTYESDQDSYHNTPYQVATSVKRRQLKSSVPVRFHNQNIPRSDQITNSGTILMRTKTGMFNKPFEEFYWVRYGRQCLYFFESKQHFDEWFSNRSLLPEQRERLVHLCIDFNRDSVSNDILGHKVTCRYVKRYRRHGQLHVFKLFKWLARGAIRVGSIVPKLAASFASKSSTEIEELFNVVLDMIRSNCGNIHLQHKLLAGSQTISTMNKIEQFDVIEFHDEYADWLLQSKLEESGFILHKRDSFLQTAAITGADCSDPYYH
jgi:hypothetical protein